MVDPANIRGTLGQEEVTTKWCFRCRKTKSRCDFSNRTTSDLRGADGKQAWCKDCSRG